MDLWGYNALRFVGFTGGEGDERNRIGACMIKAIFAVIEVVTRE